MKIVTIVGARPQFVKCAPLSRELRKENKEVIVHTGQHYNPEMSEIFFSELEIPKPDYNLEVGSGTHGLQTGEILRGVESVLLKEKPQLVIVFGDTNSTLAGALAAVKLHIPLAHVEAGLRSFDRSMPEEINRIVTDHVSNFLFCPTKNSFDNLTSEGIIRGVYLVGDIMADVLAFNRLIAQKKSRILDELGLLGEEYCVLTVHRPSNTDNRKNLMEIIEAIGESGMMTIFPVHPRVQKYLKEYKLFARLPENILRINPLGYLDMIRLMESAKKILTDSGGIQKEAYLLGIPCITLRENTEWVETLEDGWNVLAGSHREKIIALMCANKMLPAQKNLYPTGASIKIRDILQSL